MSNLVKEVLKKITEMSMPIIDTYYKKGQYIIRSDIMIISCVKKDLSILFNIDVNPDESASIAIELKNMKAVNEVHIGDVFVYIEDMENIIVGEDAIKAYQLSIKQNIIQEFVQGQKELAMLVYAKDCYKC